MAKASWCNVSPMSGKGDGTLTISAAANPGRDSRSTTVTVTAKNGTKPSASIAVSQAGVGVQLTMDTSKPDLPGKGGSVTINGSSNSSTLKISVPALSLPGVTVSATLSIPGVINSKVLSASETITIPGDVGANKPYQFVISLNIGRNPFPNPLLPNVDVTDSAGKTARCQFKWTAGASTLSVNKSLLSLVNAGTGQTVNVTSNDEWAAS
uniref:BACON domain-containing protein n=1 Tax=Bacteroides fragilis TaxID=817 RepID=UPI00356215C7